MKVRTPHVFALALSVSFALAAPSALAAAPKGMRVAVLEFANASSDEGLEVLGKGLQSMVTTDLSKVESLTLVERARLNEIIEEQKLGKSGLIDKKTAAKIGKLAGASHLLGGTYTVHGGQMRLDARLFSVKGGDILLAEDMTGERDAFFELEKSLVRKLVGALGVKLRPKERAKVAKIHTADFEAFKRYSSGVAKFDAKQYQAAMDELRAAMEIDSDFNLARVTLGEYEQLVSKIRAKAEKLELTQREVERMKKDAVFANDSAVAQKLAEIAADKGNDDKTRLRRLAALSYLMGFYNIGGRNHGRISRFQDHFDLMLVRARAETLARRYLLEAQELFPKVPLFIEGQHPPKTPEEVEKRIAGLAKSLGNAFEHRAENRVRGLVKNLRRVKYFAKHLTLDHRERLALYQLALDKLTGFAAEADPDGRARMELLDEIAEISLKLGDVDGASGALAQKSALMTRPRDLERVAKKIEELGVLAKLLAKTDKRPELREVISDEEGRVRERDQEAFAKRGAPGREILDALKDARKLKTWHSHGNAYWYFGDEPARFLGDEYHLLTGPRVDGMRSDRLRYYEHDRMTSGKDQLVFMGLGERDAVDARFTLVYSPAKDFWPYHSPPREVQRAADLTLFEARPEVSFVFGLRNIATDYQRDEETKKNFYPEPTVGYAVRLLEDDIQLVKLGQDPPAERLRLNPWPMKALAKKAGAGTKAKLVKVRVRVRDGEVIVELDGRKKAAFDLPKDMAPGFVGFHLRGQGYVEIAEPKIEAP